MLLLFCGTVCRLIYVTLPITFRSTLLRHAPTLNSEVSTYLLLKVINPSFSLFFSTLFCIHYFLWLNSVHVLYSKCPTANTNERRNVGLVVSGLPDPDNPIERDCCEFIRICEENLHLPFEPHATDKSSSKRLGKKDSTITYSARLWTFGTGTFAYRTNTATFRWSMCRR